MEHDVFWIPIVGMLTTFGMIVAIVWLIVRARQRTAQYRAEVQMKMLDRFGSATEFAQFLESPAGREFLNEPRRSARDRAIGGIRTGIILLFIGCGFGVGYWAEHDPGFFIPAFILVGLGIGFLISSAVSWKLAKQWDTAQTQ
ncbi:MAG: hypothetical protein DMF58_13160 [Acidobacteria bacterium]|nr:MAG: hypothetical protein DMF58_13160 [Acidobacteriota bacterium]